MGPRPFLRNTDVGYVCVCVLSARAVCHAGGAELQRRGLRVCVRPRAAHGPDPHRCSRPHCQRQTLSFSPRRACCEWDEKRVVVWGWGGDGHCGVE
eukprot:3823595-Rhodomonas_salina.6